MSGGTFNYDQSRILNIAEELEEMLERQGKEIPEDEMYYSSGEQFYETYPENVQFIMREAIHQLKRSYVFVHRIDWYLAGDDSEESLYKNLTCDLAELENKEK